MAKQNNSDWMSEYQDKELERIEKDISSLYSNAAKEVNDELAKFTESYEKQLVAKQAELDAGDITKSEYQVWVQKQMLQTDRYKATINHMTDILVKSDKAAMAVVNNKLPSVVAESYNFSQALGFEAARKAGLSVGTFQVYNAKSVQKIIKDNPKLLKEVDVPEDKKWNQTKINREITTGLLKGESIPKVSDRLRRVTDMDKNAATRNARTAMTAAENVGRSESAEELKDKGIPVEEVWSAAIDKRTRETHILLDGTVKDENGYFGADILLHPLRYPADPDGDPEEIYNCRCRLNIQLKGIDHSNDKELYEKFMQENDPESYKRIREVDEPKEEAYQKNKEKAEASLPARQERIRQARQSASTAEKIAVEEKTITSKPTAIPVMPENVRKGYDKFETKYIDSKVENGRLYDKNGELVSESKSKRGTSVNIASESTYQDVGAGAFEIHNHTGDELFSWKDIFNYDQYGMNGTITIPSGWEYTLYNTKEPRWTWDDTKRIETEDQWLSVAWHKATEEISDTWREERRAYIDTLQDLERETQRTLLRQWDEDNSRISREERWLEENAEKYGFIFEKRKVK